MLPQQIKTIAGALFFSSVAGLAASAPAEDQLSWEQMARIRSFVAREKQTPAPLPPGYRILVGVDVPTTVELQSFPADVGLPEYRYAVIGTRLVLVRRKTRRIVDIYGIFF
jgi:hypothetical protein